MLDKISTDVDLAAADAKFVYLLGAVLNRANARQLDEFRRLLADVAATHGPEQGTIVRSWIARLQFDQRLGQD